MRTIPKEWLEEEDVGLDDPVAMVFREDAFIRNFIRDRIKSGKSVSEEDVRLLEDYAATLHTGGSPRAFDEEYR